MGEEMPCWRDVPGVRRSSRRPRGRRPLLVGLLALLACPCCTANRATTATSRGAVSDLRVYQGDFRQRVLLTGELKAVQAQNIIVPTTPTWQMPIRWMEQDGAYVVKGQTVLELDNAQFAGDLEQKRLAEAKTVNDLAKKEADIAVQLADKAFAVETARTALEKARLEASIPAELLPRREYQEKQLDLERKQVACDKAVEELESYQESSEAELDVLKIALRKARREIELAEKSIQALTLNAPADGILIVAENPREGRKFQVGDNAWTGLAVMRMPDLSAMKVVAWLSDVDDGSLQVGMPARCTLDTYPELEFSGEVAEISPIAQEHSWRSLRRAFRVTLNLGRADPERMRPGMSVKVEIEPEPRENVLLAPRAGLELASDPPRARLAAGGTRDVVLGPCNPTECVVEEGLEAGTRLRAAG